MRSGLHSRGMDARNFHAPIRVIRKDDSVNLGRGQIRGACSLFGTAHTSRPICTTRRGFVGFGRAARLNGPPPGRVGGMEAGGSDTDGREFRSAMEMWKEELGVMEKDEEERNNSTIATNKRRDWYQKGIAYWQGVEASVDGVLGGYGCVNEADVRGSQAFLQPLLSNRFGRGACHLVALDCGSGIGRVTKNLLLKHFNEVDLVEPVSHFLDAARENLASDGDVSKAAHRAVNFYCVPLQEFTPEVGRYDVIWVQWCIGQLPDDDFVSFFKRAKAGLKHNGFFVVKENVARTGFVLDKEDQSITRSDQYFKELFNQCGLYMYSQKDQKGLPQELFPVKMYALVTNKTRDVNLGSGKARRYNKPAVIM